MGGELEREGRQGGERDGLQGGEERERENGKGDR